MWASSVFSRFRFIAMWRLYLSRKTHKMQEARAVLRHNVFGNGTSGFAKDISEHIIQFEVALAFEQDYTQAFSSLSEGMQAAWVLYTKYDLSINDIAQHLNLP